MGTWTTHAHAHVYTQACTHIRTHTNPQSLPLYMVDIFLTLSGTPNPND